MHLTDKEIAYFADQLPNNLEIAEKPAYSFIEDNQKADHYRLVFFHKEVVMKSATTTSLSNWVEFLKLECSPDELDVITRFKLSQS
ncbi:hypothetical protein KO02_12410 [Sphingobacterium sp. ML3W]|uniref:hypothetical protein n=1 Tax=Sphingobacterium sp. ML3W TaxID=1538644 RepID=UPI0004F76547|nr:hypothetical protein [Sphingobacterium sp. ML3W]AIM37404.1 hypothetical protein KO02_12410 [Sphingobacterium sp. ML3W]